MSSDDEKKKEDKNKVDVIDFIIQTLREHEHALDDLVKRLELVVSKIPGTPSVIMKDWDEFTSRCGEAALVGYEEAESTFWVDAMKLGLQYTYREELPLMRVKMKRDGGSYVTEVLFSNNPSNTYPLTETKLRCGLEGRIESTRVEAEPGVYIIDTRLCLIDEGVRPWLAEQLEVDEKSIFKGRLST